jgi:hypothetical protein
MQFFSYANSLYLKASISFRLDMVLLPILNCTKTTKFATKAKIS